MDRSEFASGPQKLRVDIRAGREGEIFGGTRSRLLAAVCNQLRQAGFHANFVLAVGDQAQAAKLIHEPVHSRPRRSHHVGKLGLRDAPDHSQALVMVAVIARQAQEHGGKAEFAVIDEMEHEDFFVLMRSFQHLAEK